MTTPSVSSTYGVHSEVGRLRKVLVCRARPRPPPADADQQRRPALRRRAVGGERAARPRRLRQQADRTRGVEVVELHDLLAQTMALPGARDWLLDRKIVPNQVGLGPGRRHPRVPGVAGAAPSSRSTSSAAWPPTTCPTTSASGYVALARESTGAREYLMPPLPNTLYTRDTTCWLYGGLTLNPLYWPARHDETLLMKAIYQFHPDFVGLHGLVGRPRAGLGPGDLRGRRHHAGRQRRRADGHERAHLAPGDHPGGGGAVRPGRRRAGGRRRDAEAARGDAPRHGVHLRRPRHRHALPDDRGRGPHVLAATRRQGARRRGHRRGLAAVRRRGRRVARAPVAAGDRDRRRRLRLRAPAVGQRQQRGRARAGRGVHLRPQHPDQHAAAQGRRRGDHDRRRRARPRPRRRALHDLPDHPRRRWTSSDRRTPSVAADDRPEGVGVGDPFPSAEMVARGLPNWRLAGLVGYLGDSGDVSPITGRSRRGAPPAAGRRTTPSTPTAATIPTRAR